MQRANYAAKIPVLMPLVSAMVAGVTARGEHASILICVISVFAGFLIGVCVGALAVGISGLFLSFADRGRSSFVLVVLMVAYFVTPLIFLAVSFVATLLALRWIL